MASIFSVFGEILIDNTNADKSIDTTTKKAEKSSKEVGVSFSSIAKGAAAVGTAVVTGAAALGTAAYKMATDVADTAGAIDDAAKKVGTSAEEYQKWAYAAKLGGMETSKLEALMVKQQKAFSDAKDGSKSMSEAYQRLGVDISKIGNSGDAFNEVIAKLADPQFERLKRRFGRLELFGLRRSTANGGGYQQHLLGLSLSAAYCYVVAGDNRAARQEIYAHFPRPCSDEQ